MSEAERGKTDDPMTKDPLNLAEAFLSHTPAAWRERLGAPEVLARFLGDLVDRAQRELPAVNLDPERFARALDEGALFASVMWANNETGVIQPIPELARIARERGVLFHTDAVQVLGKLSVPLGKLPVDLASFSAHKLGGPKGIGALYLRPGSRVAPLLRGGPQERRRRAGTGTCSC